MTPATQRQRFESLLRRLVLPAITAGLGAGLALPALARSLPDPRLVVETGEAVRLRVEAALPSGGVQTTLIREAAGPVVPGRTGRDGSGRAAFATWTESGRTWFSWSRDFGATWTPAANLSSELRLRDSAVGPGQPLPEVPAEFRLPAEGRLFLVQFRTIGLPEWREELTELGAEVLSFFPDNAHIVRMSPALAAQVRGLSFVERVEPYHPWFRLEPALKDWLQAAPAGPVTADDERLRLRVVALQWGEAGKRRIAEAAVAAGGTVARLTPHGYIVELWLDRSELRLIAAHDDVLSIDRWSAPETDMDLVRQDSGQVWAESTYGTCGQGVRGELLDEGIEPTHMDFADADSTILFHGAHDVSSHGTSTYGIVFGNGDRDGDGQAKGLGAVTCAGHQGIFADYGFLTDRFAETEELKHAPYFASFQSNSWGDSLTTAYTSISQELDDIIWRLDIAITQSQSNNGNRSSRPQAWAKNVISVGGVNHYETLSTADDCWCGGASIGPADDGRLKPDVSYWYDSIYTTTTGNSYTSSFGGTSAATPETAGVLGIILQMWAENVWGTNPAGSTVFDKQPHFATLKALLINSAVQYPFSGTTSDLTRVHQGWGRANARNARERAAGSLVVDESVPLQLGQSASWDVSVTAGEPELKITMVYPDPPGTTSATLHRINNLNLKVTAPGGSIYHGNVGLDSSTVSAPGGSPNGVDTVENVFVTNPAGGSWHIEVSAAEINQDGWLNTPATDAVFALVATGGTPCPAPAADFTATPNPGRVGSLIAFDSTVSGGGGGPFTYAWDFDRDGSDDSTAADPSYVFTRPFNGSSRLRVHDGVNCPGAVDRPVTITGPDLRFDSFLGLTEVTGNHNGAVDAGEIWDLTVRLKNTGNETALGVTADLAPAATAPGPLSVIQKTASFGTIAAGGNATGSQAYRFQVGQNFPCGSDALFTVRLIHSQDPANTYPDESAVVAVLVGGAGGSQVFFTEGFETGGPTNPWSTSGTGGDWQFNAPLGKGGQPNIPGQPATPDPTAAYAGTKVMGNDLTGVGTRLGNYENGASSSITSPALDATQSIGTEIRFARWLNVQSGDTSRLEVSGDDGGNWSTVWETSAGLTSSAWALQTFGISSVADGKNRVRVRFSIIADANFVNSGWNVDDLKLAGTLKTSCQPVSRPVPGQTQNLQVARSGGSLQLTWAADCGGGTGYGIYRGNLAAGYSSIAPEPGFCSVVGITATLPLGAGMADFFLVVPNDGAFEGSYGTASTGAARPPAATACWPRDLLDACAP